MDLTSKGSVAVLFAVDLVNAREAGRLSEQWVRDLWRTERWPVRHVPPAGAAQQPALGQLVGGLEALAADCGEVFRAPSVEIAAGRLSALLEPHELRLSVSTHDGQPPHLHVDHPDQDLAGRLRVNCLAALAGLLAAPGGRSRLGGCAAEPCRRVFVDRTRSARQRYCSPSCASRANVAAHRARLRRQQ